jgi:sugar lactone lactonase YvrE
LTGSPRLRVVERTAITAPVRTDGDAIPSVSGEIYALGAAAGESPVWLASPGVVASVDVGGGTVHLLHLDEAADQVVRLPSAASACAALTEDTLLLAAGRQFDLIDLSTGIVSAADFPGEPPLHADLNDFIIDRRGRIWAGARPPRDTGDDGVLMVWEPHAAPAVMVDGLRGPNGLALNAAGDRLYLADSRLRTIFVHALDQELGTLGSGAVFAAWCVAEGRPDGLAIDADDHLWVAAWDAHEVRRYAPDGRLDRAVAIPAARPSSCAFGGPRLDRLLVTSARPEIDDPDDQGGSLFVLEVGVTGLAVAPWLW